MEKLSKVLKHRVYQEKTVSYKDYKDNIVSYFQITTTDQEIGLVNEWEQKTSSGKYTHIYFHDRDSDKGIEIEDNVDRYTPKYPLYSE